MSNDVMIATTETLARIIRADLTESQQMHLDQLEIRIHDNRNRAAESMLEIGRCLNEAKDAKLVPHGQWQDWVTLHSGFDIRNTQRMMQAAREIPKASTLTHLDFSKVCALLALPADQREDFAADVDAEHKSVRELQAAIKARTDAEKRMADAEREKQRAMDAAAQLNAKVEQLQKRLDEKPAQVTVEREVVPADYEQLKSRDAAAAARVREAEDYAEAQEQRVRELQDQLAAANAGQSTTPSGDTQAFISSCSTFFGDVCRFQNMTDAELLGGKSNADISTMLTWVRMIESWAGTMSGRLNGIGGDGYVR